MHGRIWLGLHFRRAMTDGNLLGHLVAEQVQSALVPTSGRGHRAG